MFFFYQSNRTFDLKNSFFSFLLLPLVWLAPPTVCEGLCWWIPGQHLDVPLRVHPRTVSTDPALVWQRRCVAQVMWRASLARLDRRISVFFPTPTTVPSDERPLEVERGTFWHRLDNSRRLHSCGHLTSPQTILRGRRERFGRVVKNYKRMKHHSSTHAWRDL